MVRREFSKAVKLAAWKRAKGACERCTAKIIGGVEYHHEKEDTFGGEPVLENCVVLCITCHRGITGERAKVVAKSNRVRNKFLGIKTKKSRSLMGSKASGWKRKMDGTVVRRGS